VKKLARRLVLGSLTLLFFTVRLHGLDPRTRLSQYGHSDWRLQDGVLNSSPTAIAQSKDGYIWIGTETGLLRFDGVRFLPWTPPGWEQTIDPEVISLLAASDGTLWIGMSNHLASWRDGKLTVRAVRGHINRIVEDHLGRIWIAATRSPERKPLCEVSSQKIRCFGKAEGVPISFSNAAEVESDGDLIGASSTDVIRWSPERGLISSHSFDSLKRSAGLMGITALLPDWDGKLLIGIGFAGKGLGLQQLEGDLSSAYHAGGFDGSSLAIQALHRDQSGGLWIGTYSTGLYRISGSRLEHFAAAEGLSGDSVRSFWEDREGNMWVATDGGVDCFHDSKLLSWSSHEGLPPGLVSSVLAVHDGGVFIGSHNALHVIRDERFSTVDIGHELPVNQITALLEDASGHLWMGVLNDLAIFDQHRFRLVKYPDGRSVGLTYSLALDADGSIWASVALPHASLLHITKGEIQNSVSAVSTVGHLAADRLSGVWFTDRAKLGHYSGGKVEWVPLAIKRGNITDVITAPDGSVFASTSDGVWGVRNETAHRMGISNGLPCEAVNAMVFSGKNALLLRSTCGLILIAPDALAKWWGDPNSLISYQLIDGYDGAHLSNATFSPQMSLASDGKIWMANEVGIQVLDPDRLTVNQMVPPVHIEEVVADHSRLDSTVGLSLPPLTRDIEIHYTALSFSLPRKVQFRYKLDGRDTAWQEPGTRRTAFYQNLRPGHYKFHVIASNNDGVWNNVGDSLEFSVRPAWFQTLWFRAFSMLFLFSLVVAAYRARVRYIAKTINARYDERLEERTRMARELHDTFLQTVQSGKMVADDALDPASDEARMRHALERLSLWLGQAVREGRAALHALRVSTTERNHLTEFLERTANEYSERSSLSASLTVVGEAIDLHPIVRDEIARIAEEAIRNASEHSNASHLHIELRYERDLHLQFKDNGLGIDPDVILAGKPGHFGLQGMRERSARIGARISITSDRNIGTEISLRVPGVAVYRKNKETVSSRLSRAWQKLTTSNGRHDAAQRQDHDDDRNDTPVGRS
jgi:signal transduction histidine kinase/ligand-binding sensor domain-containing protein